jgi:hypothetical protein
MDSSPRTMHVQADPKLHLCLEQVAMTNGSEKYLNHGVSLPLVVALLTFISGVASGTVYNDADTYWHLAAGKWMLEHNSVPHTDPFSFTMLGAPWTAHEWGSELVMSIVHNAAGWQGLQLLFALAFAATTAFVARQMLSYLEPVHVVVLLSLCVAMMHTHFLIRPHVLAWPLIAVWFSALSRSVEAKSAPPVWLLPLLLVWTNFHASFTLGLAFLAGFALDALLRAQKLEDRKRVVLGWGAFGIAAGFISLLNPRGWHAYSHAIKLMGMEVTLSVVREWESTDFHEPQLLTIWLLLTLLLAFSGRLRLSLWRGGMLFFMLYLALKHNRYHSLLALTSPFLVVPAIKKGVSADSGAMPRVGQQNVPAIDALFASMVERARPLSMALVFILTAGATLLLSERWRVEPPDSSTPQAALDYAQQSSLSGPVFNAYGFGGYLIFRGLPVFVDGRADLYGDKYIASLVSALSLTKSGELEQLLSKHQIAWTLLEPNIPAVRLLDLLPEWERVYSDSVAIIHRRRDIAAQPLRPIAPRDSEKLTGGAHKVSRTQPRASTMLPAVEWMLTNGLREPMPTVYQRSPRNHLHVKNPSRRKWRSDRGRQEIPRTKQLRAALRIVNRKRYDDARRSREQTAEVVASRMSRDKSSE